MLVSIIICTYNRCDILYKCLQDIEKVNNSSQCEVIVIDNNSTDNTKEVCHKFSFCSWILEKQQGLSHARNRGAMEANGDWLFYIDDDMFLHPQSIDTLKKIIKKSPDDVGVIGGSYDGLFLKPRPVWLTDIFVSFKPYDKGSIMTSGFVHGGIFCVKKLIFEEVGSFNTRLGMVEKKLGYGEEEEFQNRVRKAGYEVYFDPSISGSHLVGEHKYGWKWYVASGYQLSKSNILCDRFKNENVLWFLIKRFLLIGYKGTHYIRTNFRSFSLRYFIMFMLRQFSSYLGFVSGFWHKYFL